MKQKIHFIILSFLMFTIVTNAQTSSNEKAAREWITAHSRELNIKPYHNFKLSFVRKGLAGETLRFQQMVNDVPVYDNEIVINFVNSDEVAFSSNNYDETIENINTTPTISKNEAVITSNNSLGFKGEITNQECNLVVTKINNQTKLVYRVVTIAFDMKGSWEVSVDAQTGDVMSKKDVAIYHHNNDKKVKKKKEKKETLNKQTTTPNYISGTANVFNPDPLSQAHVAYTGSYIDAGDVSNPSLDAARTTVNLPEIELTSGVYKLKSSLVEIKDLEAPSKGLFTQNTPNFLFNREQDGFEASNAFFHLDNSLRYINYTLGIPCLPLTNSGVLSFDPSGFNGDDNSYYSSGNLVFGEGGVDDAEDADVILHEMGHGIHDWLTGGHASGTTGLGEGNGDYWAMSYSRSLNQWASSEPAYNWVFSWDGHNEWWDGRITNYTRTYPQTGSTYTEIHVYGQIWATALMKIYDVIGKTKMDKAFLEGLALTNSSSNQKTAAVAVRQAAINMNYPCADIQTMTTKFNAAGYAMTALPLSMAAIANQTVSADANNTYTLPSYANLANPIVANCNAVITQSPVNGTVLTPGTYTITMTATSGTTVTRSFTLTITPNLGVTENVKQNVVIYPNPAKNQITLKGEFDVNESIAIYNMLGQKVIEKTIKSNEEKIDISNLSNGVYSIYFNIAKATYKFVKE